MPGPLYAFDAATLGNKINAMGGRGVKESKVFYCEPLRGRRHDLGKVPRDFMWAGAASVGDKFSILGGSDPGNILFQCLEGTLLSQS